MKPNPLVQATVPTEPHYLETLYRDLALALGDAIWAFAKIEWLTYESLGRLSVDELDKLVSDVSFSGRTGMLRRLVARREVPQIAKDRANTALKVVEKLAEERNIIAHNPWRVWVDLDQREFMTEIQRYANLGKKLDLNELRSFIERATVAEIELRNALDAL